MRPFAVAANATKHMIIDEYFLIFSVLLPIVGNKTTLYCRPCDQPLINMQQSLQTQVAQINIWSNLIIPKHGLNGFAVRTSIYSD